MRAARVWTFLLVVSLFAGLVAAPSTYGAAAPSVAPASSPSAGASVNLTVNGNVANLSATFWGVSLDGTVNPGVAKVASLLNATPIRSLRYGAAWSEEENWSNGCMYQGTSTCSGLQNVPSSFATLCQWLRNDYCILGLPAEINSAQTALYLASHLRSQTGWSPNCWQIGNEPRGYSHFGLPWTSWKSTDSSGDSASSFALVSRNYTDALRHAFPGACVIGITTGHEPQAQSWVSATTAAVTNLSAVAFHAYDAASSCVGDTAAQYLSYSNLVTIAHDYTAYVKPNATSASGPIPAFNTEFGTGSSDCPLMAGYSNAVFLSAGIAQALALGMPMVSPFRFFCGTDSCMYNSSSNRPTPSYSLYSGVLAHMDIAHVYNVTLSGANAETWAVEGRNGTDETMLFVNANATAWENLSLPSFVPAGDKVEAYSQNWASGITSSAIGSSDAIAVRNQTTLVVHVYLAASTVPPAPTNVSIGATTGSTAVVKWSQSTGGDITNNTVYSYLGSGCTGVGTSWSPSPGGDSESLSLFNLSSDTVYSVEVTSWNLTGQSSPSACVAFTTSGSLGFGALFDPSSGGMTIPTVAVVAVTVALILAVAATPKRRRRRRRRRRR